MARSRHQNALGLLGLAVVACLLQAATGQVTTATFTLETDGGAVSTAAVVGAGVGADPADVFCIGSTAAASQVKSKFNFKITTNSAGTYIIAPANGTCTSATPATVSITTSGGPPATAAAGTITCTHNSNVTAIHFTSTKDGTPADVLTAPFNTFTATRVQNPRVSLNGITQTPTAADTNNPSEQIVFRVSLAVQGASNGTDRVIEPANCAPTAADMETAGWGVSNAKNPVLYDCTFANRSMVPTTPVTWTVPSNASGCVATYSTTFNIIDALLVNMSALDPADKAWQMCSGPSPSLFTYKGVFLLSGVMGNVTTPANCSVSVPPGDTRGNALGNGMYGFQCSVSNDTVDRVRTFTFFGDSNLARNVTLPTPVIAVQPTVTIGAVSQNGFLRPRGGLHQGASNPDTVASFKVAVTWANSLNFIIPDGCDYDGARNNATMLNLTSPPLARPGFSGTIHFVCNIALGKVTDDNKVLASDFTWTAVTGANGCNATDSRNLTVAFEPAVNVGPVSAMQTCAATPNLPVVYKVGVTYTGSTMPPNVTGPCTVSAGSINATGYGELQYDCTYPNASAAAAAAPLEFVAIGRISTENKKVTVAIPAPVNATQPAIEIVSGPTQARLLKFGDWDSSVNFTLAVRVTGAVSGLMMGADGGSVDGKCVPANASAVAAPTVDGIHNYTCTFNNAGEVPRSIFFLARTPAQACYAQDSKNFTVVYEPLVSASVSNARQLCLEDVNGSVTYEVDVRFSGAKRNRTWPANCTEGANNLNINGTGRNTYTCTFANASAVKTLRFTAFGLITGDAANSSVYTLGAPIKASKPTVTVGAPVQDILKAGDNSSAVSYTLDVSLMGAKMLSYFAENGDCNATTPVTYVADSKEAIKLTPNTTTKVNFVCSFPNKTAVPTSILFAGLTDAEACWDLKWANITATVTADAKPVEFSMHFTGMNYADLIKDADKTQRFKQGVRQRVSMAVGLPIGNVEVTQLQAGSVIATVVLHTPATWTPEQLTTAAETLAAPADVFDASFLTEWDIKSVDVQVKTALPKPKAAGLSKSAQIGIGVGAGAGGLLLIGGAAGLIISRRRRMSVEPRDHMA